MPPATHRSPPAGPRQVVLRVGAALLGGYAFTWGFAAAVMAGGVALGADFHTAETAANLLAFLVLLAAFLWACAVRSLARAWLVLVGGGAALAGLAWMLQAQLLN